MAVVVGACTHMRVKKNYPFVMKQKENLTHIKQTSHQQFGSQGNKSQFQKGMK